MEVALDPWPLGVGGGDDPAARSTYLGELRAHLGRQPLVLEHEPGRRPNRFDERRLVEQCRIVNERSDNFTSDRHQGDRPIWALRQLERLAGGVDVAAVIEPIHNLERWIAEHPGKALAEAGFTASGAITDKGTVTAYRTVKGAFITLRFVSVGTKGTITFVVKIDTNVGTSRWTITSGTRAYKGLHGSGTESENFDYTVSTLTGAVSR